MRMRALSIFELTIVLAAAVMLSLAPGRAASAEITTDQAIDAIQRYVCLNDYWGYLFTPSLGATLPMSIRKDGDRAYAWVEDLSRIPYGPRVATFLSIFSFDGRAAVGRSQEFTIGLAPGDDELTNRSRVFRDGVETALLTTPADCTPHFDADAPRKQRMLGLVESRIAEELLDSNKRGMTNYSRRVEIVVANFNSDYPRTFVLVPETGKIFEVVFRAGAYFVPAGEIWPIFRPGQIRRLTPKIKMHGIPREIDLGG